MYRHLDDAAPPAPDPTRLRSVLRRSDRIRTLRRRVWAAGLLGLALCSALAVTALGSIRSSPPSLTASETVYQFNRASDPLPSGTPVPTTSLTDVVFVDPGDGFALAAHRGGLVLAATTDGGSSWQVVNGRLPVTSLGTDAPAQMEFTGRQNGYLWEGAAPGATAAPLWVTADGGRSWARAPLGPVVSDVSAIGPNVWALVGSCPQSALGPACTLGVTVSADAGSTWRPAPGPVPASLGNSAEPGLVELARVSRSRAYVLSMSPGGNAILAFTADGAATWATRPVPCARPFDLGAELALSGTDDLWLVCGGQASAGSQAKALYRSSTGGASWSEAAQTMGFAGASTPVAGVGSLPLAGYVAPYSIGHKNLNVVSADLAWLFPSRGTVVVTTDGGTNWAAVPSLRDAGFGAGAPGNLTFISSTDGWITELGTGLWRTTDGTAWFALGP